MQLEKWYCDVSDGDRVDIRYLARLTLGPTVVGYCGNLGTGGRSESSFQVGNSATPTADDKGVQWPDGDASTLTFDCEEARGPCIELWKRNTQRLTWEPVALNARVAGAGYSANARGYVERLTMNFGPWQLGLKRLVWGRFCGQKHSLAWIVWEGRHAKRLLLLDGRPVDLQESGTTGVVAKGGVCLDIGLAQTLISERLDHGALEGLPLPSRLQKLQFLRGLETKWHAPARLRLHDNLVDEGTAIFEEVSWF